MTSKKPKMRTIAADIYNDVAEDIAKGRLQPGQKLDEKGLAERFGVSRTPVREALRELAARGLIEMSPHRGAMVAQIDPLQIADMLEAECELESTCARLAAQRMTPLEREQLLMLHTEFVRHVDSGSFECALEVNRLFHDQICKGAHNTTLAGLAVDLRLRLAPFRQSQTGTDTERMHRSREEHELVVKAIKDQDPSAAYTAMAQHNTRLSAGVLQLLAETEADRNVA